MYKQSSIDFPVHVCESNRESEGYLESNKKRIVSNCRRLIELLMAGERLTCNEMYSKYGIGDGRRRICDLKEAEIRVSFETNFKVKTWFMTEEDIAYNKTLPIMKNILVK